MIISVNADEKLSILDKTCNNIVVGGFFKIYVVGVPVVVQLK